MEEDVLTHAPFCYAPEGMVFRVLPTKKECFVMSDLSVVKNQNRPTTVGRARAITLTAMLSAVAFVL